MSGYARRQAVLLLASCANQDTWQWGLFTSPGFSHGVRNLARKALIAVGWSHVDGDDWRAGYAEAEALLRTGWRPGAITTRKAPP